jgi:lipopolysaccharide/colanic/teichoic acid biosynthesis glycosyltransferase
VKRLLDVALAIVLIILTSPIAVITAAAIAVSAPGPLLFRARRVGRNGREFVMLKFRTMYGDAGSDGPAITRANDPRVTPVGAWLRRTKLDELPQLVNVLAGDMSFVGPRPEDPRYVALYTRAQQAVLTVRPGITGVASLAFLNEAALLDGADFERRYRDEILPAKLAMELEYARDVSLGRDLLILWRTLRACLKTAAGAIPAAGSTTFRAARERPPR